ncbi:uncharacterized protein LOC116023521 [Ipomoea triloba]|uniref:uncharacterized protein LOC116023521 n=1 Tax=Ipomoea triloba TaxID=35885 RepID=UPI00125CE26C|nr:uncharacterized protein LOC116023521 [Ipomoea triloba]
MTGRGIEPNPEKVRAIMEMQPPRSVKDVQRLTGRLVALSRFLSKSAEKSLPFFQILKKSNGFEWTPACQSAFEGLKVYLSSAPVLSKPEKDEVLFVYLAVSDRAVSSVLVREGAKGIQKPIYYVSKALQGAELRYTKFEKTALALWVTARRLAAYFQAHPIVVLTDQPLGTILRNPTSSGRLIKWAMMLTQFAIEYKPRPAIKGQALADFIVECTARDPEHDQPTAIEEPWWEVSTDGSSSKKGCGGGIVLTSPEGFKIYQALIFKFQPTNNEAEYEALIGGLRLAKQMKAERLRARSDSRLIIGQLSSTIDAKEDRMIQYKDILTQEAPEYVSKIARIEEIGAPSIDVIEVRPVEIGEPDWMYDLKNYIANGTLPDDSSRAKKVKLRAPRFQLVDDRLYKRSYGGPLLRCLTSDEAKVVMEEVHEGICSAHQGPRTLAQKIILMGYYWPSINLDCEQYVRRCATCQEFHKLPGRPATYYQPVSEVIPFARWGVDLIGAFPMAAGRKKYVIVAIDYFTKWVEAKALATITSQQCQKFLWKNVITRFGVPVQLITDNGTQFDSRPFKNFMAHLGIKHTRVAVAYPQSNGQVENTNRTILDGLKKKLQTAGRGWVDELSYVLWTYRTTPRRATNETPFSLTYGFEARVPIEAWLPTTRERNYDPEVNDEMQGTELNFIDEKRDMAARRLIEYQRNAKVAHDGRVNPRYFQVGDLVLRRREASKPTDHGKFAKKWEGPYRVSAMVQPGYFSSSHRFRRSAAYSGDRQHISAIGDDQAVAGHHLRRKVDQKVAFSPEKGEGDQIGEGDGNVSFSRRRRPETLPSPGRRPTE